MSRVLVIGDTHFPAVHPSYLNFVQDIAEQYRCNTFVHIGDVVDLHAISRFDALPEAPGAQDEYFQTMKFIKDWYKVFPKLIITEGNHDFRQYRQSRIVNIPARFLKGYNELYGTKKWNWVTEIVIDGVYYFHGTGVSGLHPAYNTMQKMLMSTVMGHIHTAGGIKWRANPARRLFGMDSGCGVDDKHLAFKYGDHLKVRSILSCGVVIDGMPQHIIMPCSKGERYHRSRSEKKEKGT
jgi:predicted phosphodiesterase